MAHTRSGSFPRCHQARASTPTNARAIAARVPPAVASFLLPSRQSAEGFAEQQRYVRSNTLQIVDRLTHGTYQDLRDALPGIALVQVIHVLDEESLEEALGVAPDVDALLLDSGNQRLAVKVLGGTGRTHDWAISSRIVKLSHHARVPRWRIKLGERA